MAKPKVYDLGEDREEIMEPMEPEKGPMYPSIRLTDKQLPLLKDLEVGDKISVIAILEVTKEIEEKESDGSTECEYCLDIKQMGEEGDMKFSKAFEDALEPHEEADVKETTTKTKKGY